MPVLSVRMLWDFFVFGSNLMTFGSPALASTLSKKKFPSGPKAPPSSAVPSLFFGNTRASCLA